MNNTKSANLESSDLGKEVSYPESYNPNLLHPIARSHNRLNIGLSDDANQKLPFFGNDVWRAYELSWLDLNGKPIVAICHLSIPCDSKFLIESKSLKLYFNSLNNKKFESYLDVEALITKDCSNICALNIKAQVVLINDNKSQAIFDRFDKLDGVYLDDQDIKIESYIPDANILKLSSPNANANANANAKCDKKVTRSLYSHLLKSNCPITNQPDWGSIWISYSGLEIDKASLLEYIVSFRGHQEFHEHCVERIFIDILNSCKPNKLTVAAFYTRRGGLDINPWRSNDSAYLTKQINKRLIRQ